MKLESKGETLNLEKQPSICEGEAVMYSSIGI